MRYAHYFLQQHVFVFFTDENALHDIIITVPEDSCIRQLKRDILCIHGPTSVLP